MKRIKNFFASSLSFALLFFLASTASGQIDVGDFTIRGEAEIGGMPRHKNGKDAKFEEYRDIPESVIVPQLQLMIGGKKEDFYLKFDASKVGRDDQNYILRFGRYGLLDVEFEWDQFPHLFNVDTARTPYNMHDGTYTLSSKPTTTTLTSCATLGTVCDWVNRNANSVDLKLFNGFGRFKLRYTPSPGWTFTANYSSENVAGKRAFGAVFATSGGTYKVTELPEPLDYQIHNMELGGEYAGQGWSLGFRYNLSLFHNNTSTLVWDNPTNLTGIGSACSDGTGFSTASDGLLISTRGPCRGRLDLYPSNQAHTWTLTGATKLPLQSHFMGTVSYGIRMQDDPFLPFTTNTALAVPSISRSSLDGDVRPLMVNATLVSRFFEPVNLKAYYRLYDFDNRSKIVDFPGGRIIDDSTLSTASVRSFPYAYSKQNIGVDAGYEFTRWLSAKLAYGWERMHRERREVLNADEHSLGPTFDIKPASWVLFRASYKHFWRSAPNYDAGRFVVVDTSETPEEVREAALEALRKFDEGARDRDKSSLFAQVTPWDQLTLYAGFEFTSDRFPKTEIGTKNDFNYSPSIGLTYAPLDWLRFFTDYNWERFDWKMRAMQRSLDTQTPESDPLNLWTSRGRDQINTVSVGSDVRLIKDLLGFRIQYGFSEGSSAVRASGSTCAGCTRATNYPTITNRWHELLARFEYQLHKNAALKFGYYYNRYNEKDFGVDIMKPWMGDVDNGAGILRSIWLGDKLKGAYTAHVGFLGVRFKF